MNRGTGVEIWIRVLFVLGLYFAGCTNCDFSIRRTEGFERILVSKSDVGCREFMFQFDLGPKELYSYQIAYSTTNHHRASSTVIRKYKLDKGLCDQWILPFPISPASHPIFSFSHSRIAVVGDSVYTTSSDAMQSINEIERVELFDAINGRKRIVLPVKWKCCGLIPIGDANLLIQLLDERRMTVGYALFDCNTGVVLKQCGFRNVFASPDQKYIIAFTQDDDIVCCDSYLNPIAHITLGDAPIGSRRNVCACWVDSNTIVFWSSDGFWCKYDMAMGSVTGQGKLVLSKDEIVACVLGSGKFFVKELGIGRLLPPNGYIVSVDHLGNEKRMSCEVFPKRMLTDEYFYAEEL